MLQSLTIENYALIDKLYIEFSDGLSIITGETGAGKSILLGALALILGQRADSSVLKDTCKSCVVEGEFILKDYGLERFFHEYNIDYAPITTIRRMIMPGGKSRAFINDLPITLNVVKEIGEKLIDIHSQHQNLLLGSSIFQMSALDTQAGNASILHEYGKAFTAYKIACCQLQEFKNKAERNKADYEYLLFRYNELQAAQLKIGEQQELEEELKQLSHAEEIKMALQHSNLLLYGDDNAVNNMLRDVVQTLQKITSISPIASEQAERINSCRVELRDVANEIDAAYGKIDANPVRLQWTEDRLNTLYTLQQKHRVGSTDALINVRDTMAESISSIENINISLEEIQKQCDASMQKVQTLAKRLSDNRKKTAPDVMSYVTNMLRSLGMPHAIFEVVITSAEQFGATGNDVVQFYFSANREIAPQEISRVASGGEVSRLMLCLKSLLVKNFDLPTIIFDEIDTGVSGEIADKMGYIIYELSKNMQVINITHLPQIASKGNSHFVVYKETVADGTTTTRIKSLTADERVMEIAKMLSGQNISQAAIANAKELLSAC